MADTKEPELSLERFSALVEAYGADFERFPGRERAAARALALRSREAQGLLEAARAFDGLLLAAREDLSTAELELVLERIPATIAQDRGPARLLPFRSRQQTWLSAAAAVLLGLFGGQLVDYDAPASGTGSVEHEEIASLTFADDLFDDLTLEEGGTE